MRILETLLGRSASVKPIKIIELVSSPDAWTTGTYVFMTKNDGEVTVQANDAWVSDSNTFINVIYNMLRGVATIDGREVDVTVEYVLGIGLGGNKRGCIRPHN